MVDAVASLGCMPFEMDAWGVDVAMSGSQKGLMTPPGLGFVAAGPRAREAHSTAGMRTPYWDWTFREGEEHYHKYSGTPPEHLLFALRAALDMMFAEGLDNVFRRHAPAGRGDAPRRRRVGARARRSASTSSEPRERSDTVTTDRHARRREPQPLVDYCREKCGVVLGTALGASAGKGFRIAHMGHVNAPMMLGTLGVVEMALTALGIPHGKGGVQAAVEYLAKEVRRSEGSVSRGACSHVTVCLAPVRPPKRFPALCDPAHIRVLPTRLTFPPQPGSRAGLSARAGRHQGSASWTGSPS